jgi:hypothetical protein
VTECTRARHQSQCPYERAQGPMAAAVAAHSMAQLRYYPAGKHGTFREWTESPIQKLLQSWEHSGNGYPWTGNRRPQVAGRQTQKSPANSASAVGTGLAAAAWPCRRDSLPEVYRKAPRPGALTLGRDLPPAPLYPAQMSEAILSKSRRLARFGASMVWDQHRRRKKSA